MIKLPNISKKILVPAILVSVLGIGGAAFALTNNSTPTPAPTTHKSVAVEQPVSTQTDTATTEQQPQTTQQTAAPTATQQTTTTDPVTVDSIIADAGWSGDALKCANDLRSVEPTYFADTTIAAKTVAELKNYSSPCEVMRYGANSPATNSNWTRAKYNIDNA